MDTEKIKKEGFDFLNIAHCMKGVHLPHLEGEKSKAVQQQSNII